MEIKNIPVLRLVCVAGTLTIIAPSIGVSIF